jgi:hypothetical protein
MPADPNPQYISLLETPAPIAVRVIILTLVSETWLAPSVPCRKSAELPTHMYVGAPTCPRTRAALFTAHRSAARPPCRREGARTPSGRPRGCWPRGGRPFGNHAHATDRMAFRPRAGRAPRCPLRTVDARGALDLARAARHGGAAGRGECGDRIACRALAGTRAEVQRGRRWLARVYDGGTLTPCSSALWRASISIPKRRQSP